MKMFQVGMNEDNYFECTACGAEMYSTNEDDHVLELCTMCQEYGSDYATDRGDYPTDDYCICACEDYPCCGH